MRRKLADGSTAEYHYWGRGRGSKRIEAKPNTPAYFQEIARLMDAKADIEPGRVGGLIAQYIASPAYKALKPRTRTDYRVYLDMIADEFGAMKLSALDVKGARGLIMDWRDEMASTPRKADLAVTIFSRVLNWALDADKIGRNPAARLATLHDADRSGVIWEPQELAALVAAASPAAGRAIALAAHTGLRRGDLCTLPWSAYDGSTIRVLTSKRGRRVVIPITPAARAVLDACPKVSTLILSTPTGMAWKPRHLSSSFAKARAVTKVDKRFHDLRGTAATNFVRAGLSAEEVARIMGWSETAVREIAAIYVDAESFAKSAVERLENARCKTDEKRPTGDAGKSE